MSASAKWQPMGYRLGARNLCAGRGYETELLGKAWKDAGAALFVDSRSEDGCVRPMCRRVGESARQGSETELFGTPTAPSLRAGPSTMSYESAGPSSTTSQLPSPFNRLWLGNPCGDGPGVDARRGTSRGLSSGIFLGTTQIPEFAVRLGSLGEFVAPMWSPTTPSGCWVNVEKMAEENQQVAGVLGSIGLCTVAGRGAPAV